jgi:hypothetical protein
MEKITKAVIDGYWTQYGARTKAEDIHRHLEELHKRQPLLMEYAMLAEKDGLQDSEREILYYLSGFCIDVITSEFRQIPEISAGECDSSRKANIDMLGFLMTEYDADYFVGSLNNIIEANPQPDLLRFIVQYLMKDKYCQTHIRAEKVWIVFTHIKIIIDCLAKVVNQKK